MRRATTPTHYFEFPVEPNTLQEILLTYVQDNEIVLNKTKDDFEFIDNVGSITLTQEETNLFKDTERDCECGSSAVEIQLRALTIDGKALATGIWQVPVRRVLNDEVIEP